MNGSKRAIRRRRAGRRRYSCACWMCLPSKAKLNSTPRSTREQEALRREGTQA